MRRIAFLLLLLIPSVAHADEDPAQRPVVHDRRAGLVLGYQAGIGLAGATLFYPDGTLQHAGVLLGVNGVADRPWIGTPHGFAGPYGRARAVREVSAMTSPRESRTPRLHSAL